MYEIWLQTEIDNGLVGYLFRIPGSVRMRFDHIAKEGKELSIPLRHPNLYLLLKKETGQTII